MALCLPAAQVHRGHEFAWILPETTADEAQLAVERARLADRALYSSKERGRDQIPLYEPIAADELAAR